MKRIKIIQLVISAILITGFTGLGVSSVSGYVDEKKTKDIKLHETIIQLDKLEDQLNVELKQGDVNEEKVQTLEEEKVKLENKQKELEEQLLAKQQAKQAALAKLTASSSLGATAAPIGDVEGNKVDWMTQAGISENDWVHVDFLVSKESGWNPCIINGGTINCNYSGGKAYGLPQALPGNKMASAGADWKTNPVTQLKWMNSYVNARYGGWSQAVAFWNANKHY